MHIKLSILSMQKSFGKKDNFFCYFQVNLIEKKNDEKFLQNVYANFLFF